MMSFAEQSNQKFNFQYRGKKNLGGIFSIERWDAPGHNNSHTTSSLVSTAFLNYITANYYIVAY